MASGQRHVVFGAGQIGPRLARRLVESGHDVRIVRRTGSSSEDGIPVLRGDATDPAFAREAAQGASVLYHCMNPEYSAKAWSEALPRIATRLVAAAGAAGARLVVLDNLYMLGRPSGPIHEDTPMNPTSRKGEIRARVATMLFEAHRRGDARVVCGRASDFYGPGATKGYFGDFFWPAVFAGKRPQMPMALEVQHTYHFVPDVAAGLATPGGAGDDAFGRWWMLPCAPAVPTREMVRRLASALGREIKPAVVPGIVLAAMGVFVPFMREIAEMRYQWAVPFVCDDRRFRERFGARSTPLDDGVAATALWARAQYGGPAAS